MLKKWVDKLDRTKYPFIDGFYYAFIVLLILLGLLIFG